MKALIAFLIAIGLFPVALEAIFEYNGYVWESSGSNNRVKTYCMSDSTLLIQRFFNNDKFSVNSNYAFHLIKTNDNVVWSLFPDNCLYSFNSEATIKVTPDRDISWKELKYIGTDIVAIGVDDQPVLYIFVIDYGTRKVTERKVIDLTDSTYNWEYLEDITVMDNKDLILGINDDHTTLIKYSYSDNGLYEIFNSNSSDLISEAIVGTQNNLKKIMTTNITDYDVASNHVAAIVNVMYATRKNTSSKWSYCNVDYEEVLIVYENNQYSTIPIPKRFDPSGCHDVLFDSSGVLYLLDNERSCANITLRYAYYNNKQWTYDEEERHIFSGVYCMSNGNKFYIDGGHNIDLLSLDIKFMNHVDESNWLFIVGENELDVPTIPNMLYYEVQQPVSVINILSYNNHGDIVLGRGRVNDKIKHYKWVKWNVHTEGIVDRPTENELSSYNFIASYPNNRGNINIVFQLVTYSEVEDNSYNITEESDDDLDAEIVFENEYERCPELRRTTFVLEYAVNSQQLSFINKYTTIGQVSPSFVLDYLRQLFDKDKPRSIEPSNHPKYPQAELLRVSYEQSIVDCMGNIIVLDSEFSDNLICYVYSNSEWAKVSLDLRNLKDDSYIETNVYLDMSQNKVYLLILNHLINDEQGNQYGVILLYFDFNNKTWICENEFSQDSFDCSEVVVIQDTYLYKSNDCYEAYIHYLGLYDWGVKEILPNPGFSCIPNHTFSKVESFSF